MTLLVTIPSHWSRPDENLGLLRAALEVAQQNGADWIRMVHRGKDILWRPVKSSGGGVI